MSDPHVVSEEMTYEDLMQSDNDIIKDYLLKSIPEKVWVCLACGKMSKDRYGEYPVHRGWDVS